jgi:hypothetical protein
VSLYGDSFVFGDEVDDEHAWANLLAHKLGVRIANYGVGGYGTDQAFLRFRANTGDTSSVVVLGHLSENILRVLTRDRDLLNYSRYYALKPRFVLDEHGTLRLLPLPELSEDEYLRSVALKSPLLAIEDETFQPGGPAGACSFEFPFTLSLVRSFGDFRLRAALHGRPEYAAFYDPQSPLRGVALTATILETFTREAKERGKRPIVLILPTRGDILWVRKTGSWTYGPLLEELAKRRIDVLDFGPRLNEYIGAHDVFAFFKTRAHYSEATSSVLADFMYQQLAPLQRSASGH